MVIVKTDKKEKNIIVIYEGTKRAPNFVKEHLRASKRQNDR